MFDINKNYKRDILVTILIISAIGVMFACASTNYPKMPYKPATFTGDNNLQAICRLVEKKNQKHQGLCFFYNHYDEVYDLECVRTDCIKIQDFTCMRDKDVAMLQTYIATLIKSCRKWY